MVPLSVLLRLWKALASTSIRSRGMATSIHAVPTKLWALGGWGFGRKPSNELNFHLFFSFAGARANEAVHDAQKKVPAGLCLETLANRIDHSLRLVKMNDSITLCGRPKRANGAFLVSGRMNQSCTNKNVLHTKKKGLHAAVVGAEGCLEVQVFR